MNDIRFCARCGGSIPEREGSVTECRECRDATRSSSSDAQRGANPPKIRLRERAFGRDLLAVYDSFLVVGRCRRRQMEVTEAMTTAAGLEELLANLRRYRRVEFAEVTELRVQLGYKGWTKKVDRFFVRVAKGRRVTFAVDEKQSLGIRETLASHFTDRLSWCRWRAATITEAVGVAISTILLIFGTMIPSAVAAGIGAVLASVLWRRRRQKNWKRLDPQHLAKTREVDSESRVTHATRPMRAVTLGWCIKLAGVAWWIMIASPLTDPLSEWLWEHGRSAQQWIWPLLWAPAPLLLYAGHRLTLRSSLRNDSQASAGAVVYLRPFRDDGVTSLQPHGVGAAFGTSQPSLDLGTVSWRDIAVGTSVLAMVRMLIGRGALTAEESVVRFVRRRFPVVAIGRPGERLATPGAHRLYLDQDEWQQTVAELATAAPFVVMQPGSTSGVEWELKWVRHNLPPKRVLFCMAGSWNRPDLHERVAAMVQNSMGIALPRAIPYQTRPCFVSFDDAWTPRVIPVEYLPRWKWSLVGDACDLGQTLRPFLATLDGDTATATSATAPIREGVVTKILGWVTAAVVWVVPLAVVHAAFDLAKPAVATSASLRQARRTQLGGKAAPYMVSVPGTLLSTESKEPGVEYDLFSEDHSFRILLCAWNTPFDLELDNLGRQRQAAHRRAGLQAVISRERTMSWLSHAACEAVLIVDRGTSEVCEVVRCLGSANWSMMVVIQFLRSPDSIAEYDKLAEEVLASVRLRTGK